MKVFLYMFYYYVSMMSHSDEARYGRMSLLLLNVCPFTLRMVINDYHTKHGSTTLQDFLDKNKHDIFHLMNRRCCCRLIQSKSTPMNRSQWDLFFLKNSSSCRTGYTGDCPCQYDAKPGVTSDVMDITLCCLFIKNVCSRHARINMSHIETIRTIRNQIIHAERAQLDVLTYNGYWNRVRFALLDLANNVSPTVYTDTLSMIQELETRIMNAGELGEIRKVIVDEKRIEVVEERVTKAEKDLDQTLKDNEQVKKKLEETAEKMTQMEESLAEAAEERRELGHTVKHTAQAAREQEQEVKEMLSQLEVTVGGQGQEIKDIRQEKMKLQVDEENLSRLKHRLIKVNNDSSKIISLSPLQERGEEEMPIELLFAQVLIHEDHKYREKGKNSAEYKREVTDPDDIFMMNGENIRKVYMLGDAAHGKTTYCIWLVRNWCNAQSWHHEKNKKLRKWENALNQFDFVFLLQLRNVNPNFASVIDMICLDVFAEGEECWDTIRYVLSSEKYRSLIIMDGLDEWNPNEQVRKQLKCQGMPNIHVSSTVSCFFSMRPWVFAAILRLVKSSDRVIEIQGLSEVGMKQVIENVLLNHYGLKDDPPNFRLKYNKIIKHLEDKSLKSFIQIPLLAVVCVQIWYEENQVGDSMTSFYAAMLNMLIERAYAKHKLQIEHEKAIPYTLPEPFSEHENLQQVADALLKLGKVAFEGLISNETNLVFQKRKLEKEIGVKDLQFALDVGLISKKKARSLLTKNVSVNFFHKSMQELLAAIYIVSSKEVGDSFCKHLSNVKVIMELSYVIKFICGMCPCFGSVISQQVVRVTDNDREICQYRESPQPWEHNSTVIELYKLQASWYRELQYGQTDSSVTFFISDICLSEWSDIETIASTREILRDPLVDIRSLYLYRVPIDGEARITITEQNNFLSNKNNNTRSMVMVYINGGGTDRSVHTICIPSLRCLHLDKVEIKNKALDFDICPQLLTNMTSLRSLVLFRVTLGDGSLGVSNMKLLSVLRLTDVVLGNRGLNLSADMLYIEKVSLQSVKMYAARWDQFILSVQSIQHTVDIELDYTNVSKESLTKIRSSSDFNVTRDHVNRYTRKCNIHFTRKWSMSHSKSDENDDDDNEEKAVMEVSNKLLYTRL